MIRRTRIAPVVAALLFAGQAPADEALDALAARLAALEARLETATIASPPAPAPAPPAPAPEASPLACGLEDGSLSTEIDGIERALTQANRILNRTNADVSDLRRSLLRETCDDAGGRKVASLSEDVAELDLEPLELRSDEVVQCLDLVIAETQADLDRAGSDNYARIGLSQRFNRASQMHETALDLAIEAGSAHELVDRMREALEQLGQLCAQSDF